MATKIASAHFGWLCGVKRTDGEITEIRWTKRRDSAKPFKDESLELYQVHDYLYDQGIMHDLVWESVPWVDRGE